jgi:hypothetical protein
MTAYRVHTGPDQLLEAVRTLVNADLPIYSDSLTAAFSECDPVFTRDGYCDFFWHCASTVPGWLAQVILANAEAESQGSAKLLKLWERVDYNAVVEKEILIHGKDESRHSRLFLDLVQLSFPGVADEAFIAGLRSSLPDIRKREYAKTGTVLAETALIDALVQMNIAEIRTRIHIELFAPLIYGLTPAENRESCVRILRGLARDEVRHVGYTARLMEQWAQAGSSNLIRELYTRRLRDFHAITIAQTEGAVRAFGQGRFPELLEV